MALLPLATAAEQFLERRSPAQLGQIAETHDAIPGEAGDERRDIPRLDFRTPSAM